MALPRKFLNEDEELLAELRPHWIFLFGPLFTSIGVWAGLIVLVVLWQKAPGWTNYPILILALIPGLWLLGRFVRWRSYVVALTSTRILVRQGILGRDTVQLRLQRITEVNIRQALIERVLGTGSLLIDVQGEDDSLTLEYMRKPAVVQRVINSQINEIVGGGRREAIPQDMQPRDRHGAPYAEPDTDERTQPASTTAATTTTRRARHAALRRRWQHAAPAPTPEHVPAAIRRPAPAPTAPAGHRPLRDPGPAHRARRPAPPRHPLRGGVRRQEERAAQPNLRIWERPERGKARWEDAARKRAHACTHRHRRSRREGGRRQTVVDRIVPTVKAAAGLRRRLLGHASTTSHGISVTVFETEEQARAAAPPAGAGDGRRHDHRRADR